MLNLHSKYPFQYYNCILLQKIIKNHLNFELNQFITYLEHMDIATKGAKILNYARVLNYVFLVFGDSLIVIKESTGKLESM